LEAALNILLGIYLQQGICEKSKKWCRA
jgi:hypothetical protein